MNTLKTTILLGALTGLLIVFGGAAAGNQGMFVGLMIAALMNMLTYWFSDKIVLAMYGARAISPQDAPDLYKIVQQLAQKGRIPVPRIYIIPSQSPNAFATGRNPGNAAVAVTEGALRLLNEDEIEGVLAHELSHVKNQDTLIGAIAATLAGAITILARFASYAFYFGAGGRSDEERGSNPLALLLMAVLAPLAAVIIQLAISRGREYMADSSGARMAGSPDGLANALKKLSAYSQRIPMGAAPSTAHLFIVSPLSGGGIVSLFSTHPPIEKRIERLLSGEYLKD